MPRTRLPGRSAALAGQLRTPGGLIGSIIVILVLAAALLSPIFLTDAATALDSVNANLGFSFAHPLGTDELGRDVFARILVGLRLTVALSFGAVAITMIGGVVLGVLAAVGGGAGRKIMAQITNAAAAFPIILLAVLVASLFGRGGVAAMLGLAIAGIPTTARLVLNIATGVNGTDYVASARLLGVSGWRLIARHIIPNVAEPIIALTIITIGSSLLALSALSFLGIGVQTPEIDLGSMVAESLPSLYVNPTVALSACAAIVVVGVGFSLFGEAFSAGIDPRNAAAAVRARQSSRAARRVTDAAVRSARPGSESASGMPDDTVVGIRNLRIEALKDGAHVELLHNTDFFVRRGERVGIVGESGSGKSLTVSALGHMLPGTVSATVDEHRYLGRDLRGLAPAQLRAAIGSGMPMVFQDPMGSLNPTRTIGRQMMDKARAHSTMNATEAREASLQALRSVQIPEPERRMDQHPHELSGGQRQRVMIAMALLGDPKVILADEPTTALDVSVQAQIVELLREINRTRGTAIVLVSHDLALVSQLCDRIVVMFGGRIVEEGTTEQIITDPQHPYTKLLIGAVPDLSTGIDHRLATVDDYSWTGMLDTVPVEPVLSGVEGEGR